jgi:zinc transporter 9
VDFDGTYLAAKLMPIYQQEFLQIKHTMDEELQVLLALYAEDVMRTVEREVRQVEAQIRQKYPGAEFIELEPMSMDADRLAIDDNLEAGLRRVESDALNRYLKSLKSEAASSSVEGEERPYNENPPK